MLDASVADNSNDNETNSISYVAGVYSYTALHGAGDVIDNMGKIQINLQGGNSTKTTGVANSYISHIYGVYATGVLTNITNSANAEITITAKPENATTTNSISTDDAKACSA